VTDQFTVEISASANSTPDGNDLTFTSKQGANAVAIGYRAGYTSQAANTIILNASGVEVNGVAAQTNSFYVAPIRNASGTHGVLQYNTTSNEVTYSGSITFPNATVQTTAYIAPTASYITSAGTDTISRNGMTIKITADLIIQMSFDYDGNIRGRFAVNGAASSAFTSPSPNGVVTVGVYYDIGTAMTQGDHLVATIVSASLHKVWRVTVTMRDASPEAGAYAVIEQLK
jgi:hypothetical protein